MSTSSQSDPCYQVGLQKHLSEAIELQAALNPAGDRTVERFGWTFAPGDKVMQIENDYEKGLQRRHRHHR